MSRSGWIIGIDRPRSTQAKPKMAVGHPDYAGIRTKLVGRFECNGNATVSDNKNPDSSGQTSTLIFKLDALRRTREKHQQALAHAEAEVLKHRSKVESVTKEIDRIKSLIRR